VYTLGSKDKVKKSARRRQEGKRIGRAGGGTEEVKEPA
jgi:hypothetical protein